MNIQKSAITTIVSLALVAMVAPCVVQGATIDELSAQIAQLQAQISALLQSKTIPTSSSVPAICSGITFTRSLAVGSISSEVPCLKAYLQQVLGTTIGTTTLFGPKTKAAVKQYQVLKGIVGGTGNLGPLTREKLNSILTGSVVAPPTPIPGCPAGAMYNSITGALCATINTTTPPNSGGGVSGGGNTTVVIPDTTAPAVSNVNSSNITTTTAVITWTTNEASDSQIEYGLTNIYGAVSTIDINRVASHSIALLNLTSNTTYHYRVKSRDIAGNLATSSDSTFTTATLAVTDTTAPIISAIASSNILSTSATVSWNTNEPSDTQAEYGLSSSYGSLSSLNATPVSSHTVSLSGLTPNTLYHYRVKSRDIAGNLATSSDSTFTTATTTATTGSVSRDSNGWTVVTASSDSRIIYVSSSDGNDADDGLSQANAKATIVAGKALLRNGMPDHLLFKRGDTWTEQSFGIYNTNFPTGGRSVAEPWLISYYGTGARPKILTPDNGIYTLGYGLENIAIIGLHFEPNEREDNEQIGGLTFHCDNGVCDTIILEDNYISGYAGNIGINGYFTNVQVRRNVLINSWNKLGGSSGMYAEGVTGLLIEENFFDHNGWLPGVPPGPMSTGGPTDKNHNMYITHANRDVTIRNNISSRGASMGLKFQPTGGTHYVTNNLFIQNGYGLQLGGGKAGDQVGKTGATIYGDDNVITEGNNNPGNGMGATVSNVNAGSFSNNIIANKIGTANQFALSLQDGSGWETQGWGVRNFTVDSNTFYNWRGVVWVKQPIEGNPLPVISNVDFTNNIFQEPDASYTGRRLINTYTGDQSVNSFTGGQYWRAANDANDTMQIGATAQSLATWETNTGEANASPETQVTFVDPTRTGETYAASKGFASWDAFVNSVTATLTPHSLENTNFQADTVNDYIRAGFVPIGVGLNTSKSQLASIIEAVTRIIESIKEILRS